MARGACKTCGNAYEDCTCRDRRVVIRLIRAKR